MTSRRAQRGGGHRDGEERLAGAGRADAERDRVAADRVDVALLVDGLRRDLASSGGARRRPRGSRPATCCWSSAPVTAAIVPGRDLVALLDELGELARRRSRRPRRPRRSPSSVTTLPRRKSVAVDVALERAQDARRRCPPSAAATSLESSIWRRISARSASCTSAETRLPSARPPTFAIAAFITWPMSFGDVGAGLGDRARRRSRAARRRTARRAGRPR